VIGLIDLVVERDLTEVTKIVFGSVIVAVGLLFTYGVVDFRAPLKLQSNWNPQGAAVNGIDWKSGISALVVYIMNPTDRDYDDLDISLWVSEAIVAIKQGTDIPCEHVSRDIITASGGWNHLLEMGPQRFRCDKLPRDSTIEFVITLVNADQFLNSKNLRPGDKLPQGAVRAYTQAAPIRRGSELHRHLQASYRQYIGSDQLKEPARICSVLR
jgi:hypothetical protein